MYLATGWCTKIEALIVYRSDFIHLNILRLLTNMLYIMFKVKQILPLQARFLCCALRIHVCKCRKYRHVNVHCVITCTITLCNVACNNTNTLVWLYSWKKQKQIETYVVLSLHKLDDLEEFVGVQLSEEFVNATPVPTS